MTLNIGRIALVDRGISAMRALHALREYNHEQGTRIQTVALVTESDQVAMFAHEADETVLLGSDDLRDGDVIRSRYTDAASIETALRTAQADGVWLGWGAQIHAAEIADLCARLGIAFLGNDADALRRAASGADLAAWLKQADIPIDSAGGPTRRLEIPTLTDADGTTWAVGVIDRTASSDAAELFESPSSVLTSEQENALCDAAVRLVKAANLTNLASVVFAWDVERATIRGVELRCGSSPSHAAVEARTRLDLVKQSIRLALGGRLEPAPPAASGHAVGLELAAVAHRGDLPLAARTVESIEIPTGPGLRIDLGCGEGDVPAIPHAEPLKLAALTVSGHTRAEAGAKAKRALLDTAVVVNGCVTNKSDLVKLLDAELGVGGADVSDEYSSAVALLQAAIDLDAAEFAVEQAQFITSAARGRPQVRREAGRRFELGLNGHTYVLTVFRLGPRDYRVVANGHSISVTTAWNSRFERRLTVGRRTHRTFLAVREPDFVIEVDGAAHTVVREDLGAVRSPTPAVVVSIPVSEGQAVEQGDLIAVLESMKLEMPVYAPYAGRVRKVFVLANVQVDTGAPLVQLELPDHVRPASDSGGRIDFKGLFPAAVESLEAECGHNFETMRGALLGYDVDAATMKDLMTARGRICAKLPPADARLLDHEAELLLIFTDLCSLFQRQSLGEDPEGTEFLASQEYFLTYLRTFDATGTESSSTFSEKLSRNLAHHGVRDFRRTPKLEESVLRIYRAYLNLDRYVPLVLNILERRLAHLDRLRSVAGEPFRRLLTRIIAETQGRYPSLSELAREVRFRFFDQQLFEDGKKLLLARVEVFLDDLEHHPNDENREAKIKELTDCPLALAGLLAKRFKDVSLSMQQVLLEVLTRRYYRIRDLENLRNLLGQKHIFVTARYTHPLDGSGIHVASTLADYGHFAEAAEEMCGIAAGFPEDHDILADFYLWQPEAAGDADAMEAEIRALLNKVPFPRPLRRIAVSVANPESSGGEGARYYTFRPGPDGYTEEKVYRGLHPMMGKRLHLWRLVNFNIERLPSAEDVYIFKGTAKDNPKDERIFAVAEVRDLAVVRDGQGALIRIPYLEHMLIEAASGMRQYLAKRPPAERPQWNRMLLYVWPILDVSREELDQIARDLSAATAGLGLERIMMRAKMLDVDTRSLTDRVIRISNPGGFEPVVTFHPPAERPVMPLSDYERKVQQMHRRGMIYPYEIIDMLTTSKESEARFPPGEFIEYDLDADNRLVPVSRPYGLNKANIIVGVISNKTDKYPEGMKRVILLGDPSKSVGALAEPECRRIDEAIMLASSMSVPLEWFAVSAGAKISMESGTENMDWIALVLKYLIEFTQAGGEVNIIVNGINVGAQPYWNAESTMLMHTRGILIMTPNGAMVLTGKRALDFSGSVSADDNFGIGGYERVMGPNGQAQYWAKDIVDACRILLHHYDLTYVPAGERFPRKSPTTDPVERDVCVYPYGGAKADGFDFVGEIFTLEKNADRKRAFDIRSVMRAVIDQDHPPLERWAGMRDAEIPVVWDAHLGGQPVCLLGIESKPLPRLGFVSADGPYQWTAGTLFPSGSKKVARAVNAASGNRPLVVLANLSGFDGSPESMRKCQLEFGAEIGRAVVNFDGPIIFCVVSRYHGGAYVVFSTKLNDNIEAAAIEGSRASVIGGAPAAAVVFAGDVEKRAKNDERIKTLEQAVAQAEGAEKLRLRAELGDLFNVVHSEKLGQVAEEFDTIHSVQRAMRVGSLHRIIPSATLRPYLIDALERGMKRTLDRLPNMSETMS